MSEDMRGHDRTIAAVMGANLHRLRGDHTQADLARHAKAWGGCPGPPGR